MALFYYIEVRATNCSKHKTYLYKSNIEREKGEKLKVRTKADTTQIVCVLACFRCDSDYAKRQCLSPNDFTYILTEEHKIMNTNILDKLVKVNVGRTVIAVKEEAANGVTIAAVELVSIAFPNHFAQEFLATPLGKLAAVNAAKLALDTMGMDDASNKMDIAIEAQIGKAFHGLDLDDKISKLTKALDLLK